MYWLKKVLVPSFLFVFISSLCIGAELRPSLQKHARIDAQSLSQPSDPQFDQESPVLGWLETMLTRVPLDEQVDTSSTGVRTSDVSEEQFQQELEATVAASEQRPSETRETGL